MIITLLPKGDHNSDPGYAGSVDGLYGLLVPWLQAAARWAQYHSGWGEIRAGMAH